MKCLALENRGLVGITGEDAQSLLQDVISCGVDDLPDGVARPGALLTPQGKIMFAFLISRDGSNRFLFDMNRDQIAGFVQRMTMYRLRAKADFETIEDQSVHAVWDTSREPDFLVDSRFRGDTPVFRTYGPVRPATASQEDYDRLRVENGVAEAQADYALSDAFPHDVLLDLNDGVSFKKGCFVGQEVVSRMQHRAMARRRIVILHAKAPLPATGTALTSAGRNIGTLGTVSGTTALALARVDKIASAVDGNVPLMAGDVAVAASLPAWTGLSFPTADAAKEV
ncbi:folate-binding protein YgfZ [Hoeflea sp. TYP-13]|uniref:CAF17-like 4Fe-4S cluster assembly/insertion protein YgfZ n=1 Tax=Hoeflea sp. TYP-13 TaxID=3230023 RepID=UPI0034C5EE79